MLLIGLLGLLQADQAVALRCGQQLVVAGDSRARAIEICGEPDFVDRMQVHATPYGHSVAQQDWYYNFGPHRLVVVLGIRGGRIVSERSDGYGFEGAPHERCEPADLRSGRSKFHLLWHCGPPADRRYYNAFRPLAPGKPYRGHELVVYETWIYHFSERYHSREVRLQNGRVTDVDLLD